MQLYTVPHRKFWFIASFLILLNSCGDSETEKKDVTDEQTEALFTLLPGDETGVSFLNFVENQKNFNIFKYRNFYNGGGVAIGDINNDGLSDIYFTANMGPNKLYLNKGDWKFEDISESAGVVGNKPWSTGVVMADVNADGLLDIYVSNAGNMEGNNHDNDLYINNGDLTFTESAKEYNLAETGFSTHASFFDYDKDGDLDAYILNNSNIPVSSLGYAEQREKRAQNWENVPHIFRGVGDLLMRNDNGVFTDVSEEAGIYGSLIGFGLGVMITDINHDLYPDIYVSNDFYERDYLYINNQDGTFTEDVKNWTSRLCLSAMGVDISDINNDGLQDIFITDMLPEEEERVKSVMEFDGYNVFKLKQSKDFYQQYIQNTLQINNGNGSFSEVAYHSGVEATDWSWAGLMFDMDNDGYRDIYVTNGINHDLTDLDFVDFFANEIIQKMALTGKKQAIDSIIDKMPIKPLPNYAFHNNKDITFTDLAADWGLGTPSMSNGAAYGDLDNDGDLDLVVNNVNMEAFLYRNNTSDVTENNYIKLTFEGGEKNPFAIGTKVTMYHSDEIITQELVPSRGFQSSMEYDMTIGLGEVSSIDSLRVVWPNDKTALLTNVEANQTLALKQEDATDTYAPVKETYNTLLKEIPNTTLVTHKENAYNDFDYEGLIYQKLSEEGPAMAIGDVNGDGNDDIFLGGAQGQSGTLYLHSGKGNLKLKSQPVFNTDASLEDVVATFFDADADGDLDLIVGTGGNQVGAENKYVPRLYLNDGQGNFAKSETVLPSTFQNISTIAPHDFDADGDVDLFIGSRSVVGIYGVTPKHLFLENNGDGTFTDATQRLAYDTKDLGMVTDAEWIDVDGDNKKDLVTTTDWGGVKVFKNSGRRLSPKATMLDSLTGWWKTVAASDLDQDGDLDLILGNEGNNIHYLPSNDTPMKMFVNDFDNNGTIEQITTLQKNGKDYPIHQKKELTSQMVSLKKQNLKAREYSTRAIDELFAQEIIDRSIVREVNTPESVIAINDGNGNFSIKKLPARVQLSCVCGIACTDVNGDGLTDLIMGGNNFEFKPQYSQLDASYGNILLNKGDFNFEWQDYNTSGFFVKGEMKYLAAFKDKDGNSFYIGAINNGTPKIFAHNE
ncbi:VCBS repeat-containing protein [Aureisphaera galaxeae]|uniref:VCBS repeat-containing protein n=1 Tax=Aureisphaera galaxeae TaxID=1538023 RepID=UPI002350B889|nr:VCBS repeat-containing protein [Aureisphaera galaxeae]MDC8003001.1 VCBS repeat-containing protein [Aureisphaera galaxeae]